MCQAPITVNILQLPCSAVASDRPSGKPINFCLSHHLLRVPSATFHFTPSLAFLAAVVFIVPNILLVTPPPLPLPHSGSSTKQTIPTEKVGEGLAFVKLWPLDCKTGARSSTLRTGFPPPSIDEMTRRTSATGGGMDIDILGGEDGLAAVAHAKAATAAAAEAEGAAASAAGAEEPRTSSPSSPPGRSTEGAMTEGEAGEKLARAEEGGFGEGGTTSSASPSKEKQAGTLPALSSSSSTPVGTAPAQMVEGDRAGKSSVALMAGGGAVGTAGAAATAAETAVDGEEKEEKEEEEEAGRPRGMALEVEVFAIGGINVPDLMALIKVCFEQVKLLPLFCAFYG